MAWIVSPLVVLIIFGTIYKVFELFLRRGERMKILDKIEEIKDVNLSGLDLNLPSFNSHIRGRFTALRGGLLALGVGLGLLIGQILALVVQSTLLSQETDKWISFNCSSVIMASCVCLFGGLALVISYCMEQKKEREDKNND